MKCVFSFWSSPVLRQLHSSHRVADRSVCGFPSCESFLHSWMISVHQYKKFFGNAHLVTDDFGKELLSSVLKLPFDTVCTEIEELNHHSVNPLLSFTGNLLTYSIQKEPFICPDFDSFIWGPLPDDFLSGRMFCQHIEDRILDNGFYNEAVWLINKYCYPKIDPPTTGLNCGVFGGNDVQLISSVASNNLGYIMNNKDALARILRYDREGEVSRGHWISMVFEQVAYATAAANALINVQVLFHPQHFSSVAALQQRAVKIGFSHLIAGTKRLATNTKALQNRVLREYPDFLENINNAILLYNRNI